MTDLLKIRPLLHHLYLQEYLFDWWLCNVVICWGWHFFDTQTSSCPHDIAGAKHDIAVFTMYQLLRLAICVYFCSHSGVSPRWFRPSARKRDSRLWGVSWLTCVFIDVCVSVWLCVSTTINEEWMKKADRIHLTSFIHIQLNWIWRSEVGRIGSWSSIPGRPRIISTLEGARFKWTVYILRGSKRNSDCPQTFSLVFIYLKLSSRFLIFIVPQLTAYHPLYFYS